MELLGAFGPSGTIETTEAEALEYCRGLAWNANENFSVLSRFVPAGLRDAFAAVYAYCRWSDDLADETGSGDRARATSSMLLRWWRDELHACFDGHAEHPVFQALRPAIEKHGLVREPFDDLLDAFEQDQVVSRYKSWDEVLGYCTKSANPVGRIVLRITGADGPELVKMSDATCTALQLVNFWQDVRRDLIERDRIYIPADDTAITEADLRTWMERDRPEERAKLGKAVLGLCDRTDALFKAGRPLPAALRERGHADIAPVIKLFGLGGEAILRRVRAMRGETLWARPRIGRLTKGSLVLRVAAERMFGGGRAA